MRKLGAAIVVFGSVAAAQTTSPRPLLGPASLVSQRDGVPLTVRQIEQVIHKSADGLTLTENRDSTIYRDSAGRIRLETRFSDLPSFVYIGIFDPVDGSVTTLDPLSKTAQRSKVPNPVPPTPAFQGLSAEPRVDPLGREVIGGIAFVGVRIRQISAADPTKAVLIENWNSAETGLTVKSDTSTPEWTYSGRLEKWELGSPSPSLFSVPEGYTITQNTLPKTARGTVGSPR